MVASLTLEEMVLEAASRHEFVYEEAFFVLAAVTDQFHQVWVPKLTQKYHLCLQKT